MLRQLEEAPISHKQLVAEVRAIYAGIATVEAKCIEKDQRQLAAAKEKDPLQNTPLENHQWQALIALHGQVDTLPGIYSPTTYRTGFPNYFMSDS